ncbi:glycosyltransferase family 4 protein [Nibrella saemangeumensis]|uniref:Glycosyltransferase family 4 protein n=1 Tax=Nibrella saemangeumensis TaxID=1084526 RepID=A0ABP8N1L8_9BACT
MKLAVLGYQDVEDINLWSGIPYHAFNAFQREKTIDVTKVFPSQEPLLPGNSLFRFYFNFIQKARQPYYYHYNKSYIEYKNDQINKYIRRIKPDYILTFWPYQVAYLETVVPIIIWTDATIDLLIKTWGYDRMANVSQKDALQAEHDALSRATLAVYSSDWAASSARNIYNVDPNKVKVIGFGANILRFPAFSKEVSKNKCNLLFIGYDYIRKGLQKAIDITEAVNSLGLEAILTVIGPEQNINSKYVKFLGRLSKDDTEEYSRIVNAYNEATFFLLPTFSEPFGIVFCEASYFGVPSLSHNVGGVSNVIEDGVNGKLFLLDSSPNDFATYIKSVFSNWPQYMALRNSTRSHYETNLSWEVSIKRLSNFLI